MLRGIGPGNPNMTKTAFTSFFERLGFDSVRVVLASGNIIFDSPDTDEVALARRIEDALPQQLGFSRSVTLRSQAELQRLIDADPFEGVEQEHNRNAYLLITFFKQVPELPFTPPHTPENKPYTVIGTFERSIFGIVDLAGGKTPDYMAWLEKQFGKDITSRTPKTIRLILSRMA